MINQKAVRMSPDKKMLQFLNALLPEAECMRFVESRSPCIADADIGMPSLRVLKAPVDGKLAYLMFKAASPLATMADPLCCAFCIVRYAMTRSLQTQMRSMISAGYGSTVVASLSIASSLGGCSNLRMYWDPVRRHSILASKPGTVEACALTRTLRPVTTNRLMNAVSCARRKRLGVCMKKEWMARHQTLPRQRTGYRLAAGAAHASGDKCYGF